MGLTEKLSAYVDLFNADDKEYYKQKIDNDNAKEWLTENIPHIDIPDSVIEKIYYFRWWTFRKHIKDTSDGKVITEFLPPVYWGGTHNTIIAAAGHHIAEAKWLKCSKDLIESYAKFWLDEKSKTYLYSCWLIDAIYRYCEHINDYSFGVENLDLMINYYNKVEKEHMTKSGLMWSVDNNDAMEMSISGVNPEKAKMEKGLRPTLNSYMAANASAISKFAKIAGKDDIAVKYNEKYESLKRKITDILWNDGFYRAIHNGENFADTCYESVPELQRVRELIGYIPWCFNLAPNGLEDAFAGLKDTDVFKSEYGLTTAERNHKRYLYKAEHECLWNGYIWPFATSQVLDAVMNLLDNYSQEIITKDDFYEILYTYAESHYLTEAGKTVCWIDEVKDPRDDSWCSREYLKKEGWLKDKGGFERGKDYNHSTFCDIVLKGLLGIKVLGGDLTVSPKIPDSWEYFMVDNLNVGDKCYKITYDKNGNHYGLGKGIKFSTCKM